MTEERTRSATAKSNSVLWMVRAGRGARFVDDFLDRDFVGIEWDEADLSDISKSTSKGDVTTALNIGYPGEKPGTISMWASQILRYHNEISKGDSITTYDPSRRLYYMGKVLSNVESIEHPMNLGRQVSWEKKVGRDLLSSSTRNSLGSITTLFRVPKPAAIEMFDLSVPLGQESLAQPQQTAKGNQRRAEADDDLAIDLLVTQASELIEDRIARLDWRELQQLAAGLLDAMGFRATESSPGADRGVDIFASPDGLGLLEPRIFVEVKHRIGTSIGHLKFDHS